MHIEMTPNPDAEYGDVARSADVYVITGRGTHSPGFPHELIRWDFTGTRWEDRDDAVNGLRFAARPIVVARVPQAPRTRHDLRIGDTVTVDGERYVVTARTVADPILVPADR